MARPNIGVDIALGSNPLDTTQSWTSLGLKYPVTCSIQQGRQGILDRVEAGTMRLRLWDGDRLFDPINTASAYYPNVRPRKQIRIGASNLGYTAQTRYLFTGFIERVQPIYDNGERWIDITAVDAFKYLTRSTIDFTRIVESSGSRIDKVLDAVGWPSGRRSIENGASIVQAVTLANANPLQHIQDVVTTENGLFFINGDGVAVFQSRYHRIRVYTSASSNATFTNAGTALPCESIRTANDDGLLANLVVTTLSGSQIGYRADYTSQSAYMLTKLTRELPLLTDSSEGQDAASWILNQRRNLTFRVEATTLNADSSDAVLQQMFSRDISDRITMQLYPNNNPALTPWQLDHFIEGMSFDLTRDAYRCSWNLSPADSNNFFIVADATFGRVGFNKAAY